MWQVVLENPNESKTNVCFFDTERDLGIFLQNYDKEQFKIIKVMETDELFSVENSQYFIKKPKGLETGGK